MLGYPDAFEAVMFGKIDLPQRLLHDLAVRRGASARKELEDADVHHSFAFLRAGRLSSRGCLERVSLHDKKPRLGNEENERIEKTFMGRLKPELQTSRGPPSLVESRGRLSASIPRIFTFVQTLFVRQRSLPQLRCFGSF